jgi:hypothetical protein
MLIRIPVSRYTFHPYRVRVTYVHQELRRPAVYLDHWALMLFAEDDGLRGRLIQALRKSGGTLCLSHVNSAELCRVDDPRHADAVDRLVDELRPQLFFLDAAENLQRSLLDEFHLAGDLSMAEHVARPHAADQPGYFKTYWNLRHVVRSPHDESLNDIFDGSTTRMATAFNDVRKNDEFLAKARKFNPAKGHSAGWIFLGELLRQPFLNPKEGLDTHDMSDIQHALNALHCDYVLLDAGWTSKLNQARPRLDAAGVNVAACYSGKVNELEKFLLDLAAYKVSASPF